MKSFFENTDKTPFVIEQNRYTASTIVYLPTEGGIIGYCFQAKRFLSEEITASEQEHFEEMFQRVFKSTLEEYGLYLETKEFLEELHYEQIQ